jgi:hypothetical protein
LSDALRILYAFYPAILDELLEVIAQEADSTAYLDKWEPSGFPEIIKISSRD